MTSTLYFQHDTLIPEGTVSYTYFGRRPDLPEPGEAVTIESSVARRHLGAGRVLGYVILPFLMIPGNILELHPNSTMRTHFDQLVRMRQFQPSFRTEDLVTVVLIDVQRY